MEEGQFHGHVTWKTYPNGRFANPKPLKFSNVISSSEFSLSWVIIMGPRDIIMIMEKASVKKAKMINDWTEDCGSRDVLRAKVLS